MKPIILFFWPVKKIQNDSQKCNNTDVERSYRFFTRQCLLSNTFTLFHNENIVLMKSFNTDIFSQYLKEEELRRRILKTKTKTRRCPLLPLVEVYLQGHPHGDGCLQGQILPNLTKGQGLSPRLSQVNMWLHLMIKFENKIICLSAILEIIFFFNSHVLYIKSQRKMVIIYFKMCW